MQDTFDTDTFDNDTLGMQNRNGERNIKYYINLLGLKLWHTLPIELRIARSFSDMFCISSRAFSW